MPVEFPVEHTQQRTSVFYSVVASATSVAVVEDFLRAQPQALNSQNYLGETPLFYIAKMLTQYFSVAKHVSETLIFKLKSSVTKIKFSVDYTIRDLRSAVVPKRYKILVTGH